MVCVRVSGICLVFKSSNTVYQVFWSGGLTLDSLVLARTKTPLLPVLAILIFLQVLGCSLPATFSRHLHFDWSEGYGLSEST